jgi:hypothetical protein
MITECSQCNHFNGWYKFGCGAVTQFDFYGRNDYCGCKNEFHYFNRCKGTEITKRTNADGFLVTETIRCKANTYDGSSGCTDHITPLEQAEIKLAYEQRRMEYSNQQEEKIKQIEINKAKMLLLNEGFTITEPPGKYKINK